MGLTSMMRMKVAKLERHIFKLVRVFRVVKRMISRRKLRRLKRTILGLLSKRHEIVAPPREQEAPLVKIRNRRRTIDSFDDEEIPAFFRFRSKEQLHRLMEGFQIPNIIIIEKTGNVFYGEEYLLVSLYRLHRPTALSDN